MTVQPMTIGFPDCAGLPSWLVYTGPDWEVTYGDDGDGLFFPSSGARGICVSAVSSETGRWFYTNDPRGLAAALIAAADAAEAAP